MRNIGIRAYVCLALWLGTDEQLRGFEMKKCTLGNRHKWEFIKNIQLHTYSKSSASICLKGLYKCGCGATKHGVNQ